MFLSDDDSNRRTSLNNNIMNIDDQKRTPAKNTVYLAGALAAPLSACAFDSYGIWR